MAPGRAGGGAGLRIGDGSRRLRHLAGDQDHSGRQILVRLHLDGDGPEQHVPLGVGVLVRHVLELGDQLALDRGEAVPVGGGEDHREPVGCDRARGAPSSGAGPSPGSAGGRSRPAAGCRGRPGRRRPRPCARGAARTAGVPSTLLFRPRARHRWRGRPATASCRGPLLVWVWVSEITAPIEPTLLLPRRPGRHDVAAAAPAQGAARVMGPTRASGGIGRRAGFRFLCPKGCGGSSPPSPTVLTWGVAGDTECVFECRHPVLTGHQNAWRLGPPADCFAADAGTSSTS